MIKTSHMIIFSQSEIVVLPSECEWEEVTTFKDDEKGQRVFVRKDNGNDKQLPIL